MARGGGTLPGSVMGSPGEPHPPPHAASPSLVVRPQGSKALSLAGAPGGLLVSLPASLGLPDTFSTPPPGGKPNPRCFPSCSKGALFPLSLLPFTHMWLIPPTSGGPEPAVPRLEELAPTVLAGRSPLQRGLHCSAAPMVPAPRSHLWFLTCSPSSPARPVVTGAGQGWPGRGLPAGGAAHSPLCPRGVLFSGLEQGQHPVHGVLGRIQGHKEAWFPEGGLEMGEKA